MVVIQGQNNSLNDTQIKEVQKQMMGILKTLDGQAISEEDIAKKVNEVVSSYINNNPLEK